MAGSDPDLPARDGAPAHGERRIAIDCDALLIDMDGTLVDSRELIERVWLHWAGEHGVDPEAVLAVAHGRPTLETMQLVAPEVATPEEAARLDAFEAGQEGGETPVPGAPGLVAALPPDRWAVVTSASRALALARLAIVGLPIPRVLVGADDVRRGKPAPEGYLLAAGRLGVPPGSTVVLEDTPAGIEAGRRAGATVIGVCTTFPALDGCDWVVPDLRALSVERRDDGRALRLWLDQR